MIERKRYDAIDGLRAFSAIGIVLMHVLVNGKYNIGGFIFDKLIPSFTKLGFLFMIIRSWWQNSHIVFAGLFWWDVLLQQ